MTVPPALQFLAVTPFPFVNAVAVAMARAVSASEFLWASCMVGFLKFLMSSLLEVGRWTLMLLDVDVVVVVVVVVRGRMPSSRQFSSAKRERYSKVNFIIATRWGSFPESVYSSFFFFFIFTNSVRALMLFSVLYS